MSFGEIKKTIMSQSVPEEAKELLNLIKENPNISRARLSEILHISVRQVRNIIESLKSCGILTRHGGDSGRWIINAQNINPESHKIKPHPARA